jgi:hypothetical protein
LSTLQFLEVAHNFTYNPDRDSLQDEDKENGSDEHPLRLLLIGQLFEVAFNNRKYMAVPKSCEFCSTAEFYFFNIAQ